MKTNTPAKPSLDLSIRRVRKGLRTDVNTGRANGGDDGSTDTFTCGRKSDVGTGYC